MNSSRQEYTMTTHDLASVFGLTIQGVYHVLKTNNIETIVENKKHYIPPTEFRKLMLKRGYEYRKEVISFHVVKGGSGKTTLALGFAVRANQYGARVLAIDLDKQGNLTQALNINSHELPLFVHVIKKEADIQEAIVQHTNTLHVIPSNISNSTIDKTITYQQMSLSHVFRDSLKPIINNYDYIIFDCPPDINSMTAAATLASDRIVMPVNPDMFSIDGLKLSIDEVNWLSTNHHVNRQPQINIIFNRYDARKSASAGLLEALLTHDAYKHNLMRIFIRENSEFGNSINTKMSIFERPKKNQAKEDIDAVVKSIMGLDNFGQKLQ